MTDQPAMHPLARLEQAFDRDDDNGIRSREAVAVGARAIRGLMDLSTDPDNTIDPVVTAAAIEAVGAMVGGFTSGKQEVNMTHGGKVGLGVSGIYAPATRIHSGEVRVVQVQVPRSGKSKSRKP